LERRSEEREPDSFLFEPNRRSEAVLDEVVVQRAFGSVRWASGSEVGFGSVTGRVPQQRLAIHEDGPHRADAFTQTVQDREAVRVDVAPVDDLLVVQRVQGVETRRVEALAKITTASVMLGNAG
jgi:hypothetical protein